MGCEYTGCGGHRLKAATIVWVSPTVLRTGPYRLFFFASDRNEPVHVHVGREDKAAKFWLSPVRQAYNYGLAASESNGSCNNMRRNS